MSFPATMVASACLLIAAAGPVDGQEVPQTPFEPRSSPGAGRRLLEKFAGDWAVIKTFYPRSGEPIRAEGRCHQAMIHEGRFLQSDFVFRQGGKTMTGLGIIGFEPESGRFTSFWTDSRQTRMSVRQSQDRDLLGRSDIEGLPDCVGAVHQTHQCLNDIKYVDEAARLSSVAINSQRTSG